MDQSASGALPALHAFDDEFGPEVDGALPPLSRRTRLRPFAGVLLATAIISVPVLAWLTADGHSLVEGQQAMRLQSVDPNAQQQAQELQRQVAALKQEINDLVLAQQEARESILALKSAEPARAAVYWYSDPAALAVAATTTTPAGVVAVAPPRRSATARPEPRRRDSPQPLSLEAPQ